MFYNILHSPTEFSSVSYMQFLNFTYILDFIAFSLFESLGYFILGSNLILEIMIEYFLYFDLAHEIIYHLENNWFES